MKIYSFTVHKLYKYGQLMADVQDEDKTDVGWSNN